MEEFMFVVPGNPVPKRGAIVTRNGTFLDSKTTKALKDQRAFFTYEMLKRKLKPIDKAVVVYLAYYKLLPQSKKVGALAVTRPDLDNYVKLTLDVIKETVLVDDNLVIKLVASKFYCTANPRTEVRVELVLVGLGSNYNKILERDLKVQDSRKCPKCVPGKLVRNSLMGEKKLGYITFQCFSCNYCLYQKLMFTGEKEYSIKRID